MQLQKKLQMEIQKINFLKIQKIFMPKAKDFPDAQPRWASNLCCGYGSVNP